MMPDFVGRIWIILTAASLISVLTGRIRVLLPLFARMMSIQLGSSSVGFAGYFSVYVQL
jgi:hypothetical protein